MSLKNRARKLLLFDIDGTLILSHGKGKKAMVAAIENEFKVRPRYLSFKDFAGSTDRKIVLTLMEKIGVNLINIDGAVDRVLASYLVLLRKEMSVPNPADVLPGVKQLLNELADNDRFVVGLLTGNIEQGARIKLNPVGLNRFFQFGAFGSDETDRNLLPPIAVKRAEKLFRETFSPNNVWVIGDTPRDIECAKVNNLCSLAIATSAWTVDKLKKHYPNAALPNLSNTGQVMKIFS